MHFFEENKWIGIWKLFFQNYLSADNSFVTLYKGLKILTTSLKSIHSSSVNACSLHSIEKNIRRAFSFATNRSALLNDPTAAVITEFEESVPAKMQEPNLEHEVESHVAKDHVSAKELQRT